MKHLSSTLWRRRRKNLRSTTALPEPFRQLAIQHGVHGPGGDLGDCWQYQSIQQCGKGRCMSPVFLRIVLIT